MRKDFWLIFILTALVYFLSWLAFNKSGINDMTVTSEDTLPAMFIPLSIIKEGTIHLDSYYLMMISKYPHPDDKKYQLGITPYYLTKVGDHYLSAFPIISGLLSVPVYLVPTVLGFEESWENILFLSKLSSSILVALCVSFLYLLLRYFINRSEALVLCAAFAFATINYANISQALWQHGALQLFSILGLIFLLKSKLKYKDFFVAGLFLFIAVLARPTAILSFVVLAFYVFKKHNLKSLISFCLGGVLPILFFFYYNAVFYGDISNQGYAAQAFDSWKTPILNGFFGIWISPSKGLLVYSPIFLFSLLGGYLVIKNKKTLISKETLLFFKLSALIVVSHTLVIAMWKHWYGGWSFGYRMASDVILYLILLLVPYLKSELFVKTKKWFYLAMAISILIEIMGVAFFDGVWHAAYDRGFKDQSWLWSIQNSEIIFNVKRILLKLEVIDPFLK